MAFAAAHVAAYPSASRVASAVAAMVGHVLSRSSQVATICRDAMKRYEQHCIRTIRITPLGEHLLNTNKALDEHRPRANYQGV